MARDRLRISPLPFFFSLHLVSSCTPVLNRVFHVRPTERRRRGVRNRFESGERESRSRSRISISFPDRVRVYELRFASEGTTTVRATLRARPRSFSFAWRRSQCSQKASNCQPLASRAPPINLTTALTVSPPGMLKSVSSAISRSTLLKTSMGRCGLPCPARKAAQGEEERLVRL